MKYCIQGEGGGQRILVVGYRSMKMTLNFDFLLLLSFLIFYFPDISLV